MDGIPEDHGPRSCLNTQVAEIPQSPCVGSDRGSFGMTGVGGIPEVHDPRLCLNTQAAEIPQSLCVGSDRGSFGMTGAGGIAVWFSHRVLYRTPRSHGSFAWFWHVLRLFTPLVLPRGHAQDDSRMSAFPLTMDPFKPEPRCVGGRCREVWQSGRRGDGGQGRWRRIR